MHGARIETGRQKPAGFQRVGTPARQRALRSRSVARANLGGPSPGRRLLGVPLIHGGGCWIIGSRGSVSSSRIGNIGIVGIVGALQSSENPGRKTRKETKREPPQKKIKASKSLDDVTTRSCISLLRQTVAPPSQRPHPQRAYAHGPHTVQGCNWTCPNRRRKEEEQVPPGLREGASLSATPPHVCGQRDVHARQQVRTRKPGAIVME